MCSAVCEHALFAGRLQLGSQGCRVALRRLVLSRLGVCARTPEPASTLAGAARQPRRRPRTPAPRLMGSAGVRADAWAVARADAKAVELQAAQGRATALRGELDKAGK